MSILCDISFKNRYFSLPCLKFYLDQPFCCSPYLLNPVKILRYKENMYLNIPIVFLLINNFESSIELVIICNHIFTNKITFFMIFYISPPSILSS